MRILISNDDGVHSPGLEVLYREFSKLGKVSVVAPLDEKSTTGHSLTLHKPLRILPIKKDFYGVSGSPADCVYLGIREIIGKTPDIVISGINRGANLGQDVYYSGTVSAAREACILGIPALAVSLNIHFQKLTAKTKIHFESAARYALQIARRYDELSIPKHTLLNLNVPNLPLSQVKGLQLVRQGFRYYSGTVVRRRDHRGKDYFWVGGQYQGFRNDEHTDCVAVERGFASLTPLKLDTTDYESLAILESELHLNAKKTVQNRRKKS